MNTLNIEMCYFWGMPKVNITYIKNETYTPMYVSGAIGGFNVKGDLVMNFYVEMNDLPQPQLLDVKEGKVIQPPPEDDDTKVIMINRVVNTGVAMNIEAAKELHRWLGDQLAKQKLREEERNQNKSAAAGA
jgi:hypothetical protein